MTAHHTARAQMVLDLKRRGIVDGRVLEAMSKVAREEFVPAELKDRAYDDNPLAIGYAQTISQPLMVAIMCQEAVLSGQEKVLEVGAGSGYEAAVLSHLARQVIAVEIVPALAAQAAERLARLHYSNVVVVSGDGSAGWPAHAPYDAIIVAAGAPERPVALVEQLAIGGRLVVPVGPRGDQKLLLMVKTIDGVIERTVTGCSFVDLVGTHGWQN